MTTFPTPAVVAAHRANSSARQAAKAALTNAIMDAFAAESGSGRCYTIDLGQHPGYGDFLPEVMEELRRSGWSVQIHSEPNEWIYLQIWH